MELLCRAVPGGLDWDYGQCVTVSFLARFVLTQQDEINGPDNSCRNYYFNYQLFLLNLSLPLVFLLVTILSHSLPPCLQHLPDPKTWHKAQAGRASALIHATKIYHSSQQ